MNYIEFSHLQIIEDKKNPFSTLYQYPTGERFYIEAPFYTQLEGLKSLQKERFNEILLEMEIIVKENKFVVFTMDFENPATKADGYIYQEITDITDRLNIFVEDKSRGSDYGD